MTTLGIVLVVFTLGWMSGDNQIVRAKDDAVVTITTCQNDDPFTLPLSIK